MDFRRQSTEYGLRKTEDGAAFLLIAQPSIQPSTQSSIQNSGLRTLYSVLCTPDSVLRPLPSVPYPLTQTQGPAVTQGWIAEGVQAMAEGMRQREVQPVVRGLVEFEGTAGLET